MALVSLGDITYPFAAPSLSLMGPGCSKETGPRVKGMGANHVLLVTDKVLAKLGIARPDQRTVGSSRPEGYGLRWRGPGSV